MTLKELQAKARKHGSRVDIHQVHVYLWFASDNQADAFLTCTPDALLLNRSIVAGQTLLNVSMRVQ